MLRDVRKAYASFAALAAATRAGAGGAATAATAAPTALVSTGRWGCGVFGGVPAHKFLQQLLAAALAGVRLTFSTFGQADGCDELLEAVRRSQMSVGQAWELLGACASRSAFEGRLAALRAAGVHASVALAGPEDEAGVGHGVGV